MPLWICLQEKAHEAEDSAGKLSAAPPFLMAGVDQTELNALIRSGVQTTETKGAGKEVLYSRPVAPGVLPLSHESCASAPYNTPHTPRLNRRFGLPVYRRLNRRRRETKMRLRTRFQDPKPWSRTRAVYRDRFSVLERR